MTSIENLEFLISFVKLIEKHPCLWNHTLKEYNKNDSTSLAWQSIATALKDKEVNCRERWRHIRCAFVRSLKPPKSGSSSKAKKTYYLAEYLAFLLPYTKGVNQSRNLSAHAQEVTRKDSDFGGTQEQLNTEEIESGLVEQGQEDSTNSRTNLEFLVSFVQLIEKHPCLWNHTIKEYNKNDSTSLAWRSIATELKDKEANCRERWKHIRCAFVRSLKPPKSGSSSKVKKTYYLAEHLAFLLPYTKGVIHSGNLSAPAQVVPDEDRVFSGTQEQLNSEETEKDLVKQEQEDSANLSCAPSCSSNDPPLSPSHSTPESSTVTPKIVTKKRKLTSKKEVDSAFMTWLNIKNNRDEDSLFFQSLLPDVKKLDEKRKRSFKAQTLNTLYCMLDFMEEESASISPSSNTSETPPPFYRPSSADSCAWDAIEEKYTPHEDE